MEKLFEKYQIMLQNTPTEFKRYLFKEIAWDNRMIGVVGARGVGKTTMLLQYIKENLNSQNVLYVTADDLYFSENKLIDLADKFYKYDGQYLFIDEVHKYKDWSKELKNIYDSYPSLKVFFTGSSVLDIIKGTDDLSRRALIYQLKGLSFREYLDLFHGYKENVFSLDEIINNKVKLKNVEHPLPLFKDYLKKGYYPFGIESEFNIRLGQILIQTLETDIPQYANLSISTSRKLKKLLSIVAESVPFKPNFTKIAELINVSRNSLDDYFTYMEMAGLIAQLRDVTKGLRGLGKIEKVLLENTNIIYGLVGDKSNIGNIRETFFLNQTNVKNDVSSSKKADFVIDDYTFEIGGKNKGSKQIQNLQNTFLVKDEIEYGFGNVIPLWAFGMNY